MTEKKNKEKDLTDSEVIAICLGGNSNAFAILEKRYKSVVTSLVRRMVKDDEDVKDIVQETFIKAYNALATFQDTYSFSGWLFRIASNSCIDFHRKKKLPSFSISKMPGNSDDEEEYEIEDHSFMPDDEMMEGERNDILREAFNQLPEKYREILRLRHEEDKEYSEIAEELEIPLGTVKANLFRARKMLYDALKKKKNIFF